MSHSKIILPSLVFSLTAFLSFLYFGFLISSPSLPVMTQSLLNALLIKLSSDFFNIPEFFLSIYRSTSMRYKLSLTLLKLRLPKSLSPAPSNRINSPI